ncbi:hypothetical protein [Microbispora sp. NPDC046933]|uniref:hypothetical protein n=1 Tax=Microbispora sp. NPDC046933 TaxID=3155618 RepID=UPI0033FC7393
MAAARGGRPGGDALDRLYLTYRVGRWHAASRAALLRGGTPVPPFLDDLVVRTALSIDPMWRRSEEVVHRCVVAFAPRLRDVPIEGRPWRFAAAPVGRTLLDRVRRRLRDVPSPRRHRLPRAFGNAGVTRPPGPPWRLRRP